MGEVEGGEGGEGEPGAEGRPVEEGDTLPRHLTIIGVRCYSVSRVTAWQMLIMTHEMSGVE